MSLNEKIDKLIEIMIDLMSHVRALKADDYDWIYEELIELQNAEVVMQDE